MTNVGILNQLTREVWLEQALKRVPAGHRILDAGAGEQKYKSLCKHLDYVSQDFAQYDGKGDGKGLHTGEWDYAKLDIVCDIIDIPEPDKSFDAIMCIEVLEHLPEPVKALKEFSRLLKPRGHLILTAPYSSLTHFAPYHFYSGFNRYFYEKHLSDFGFTIIDLEFNGNYFEFLAQEFRRIPDMADKYSKSKISRIEKLAQRIILSMLERFSRKDHNSCEVLSFGCHVHALKGENC